MMHPFNLPMLPAFTDDELTIFCMANPDLFVERDEQGQLFIRMANICIKQFE